MSRKIILFASLSFVLISNMFMIVKGPSARGPEIDCLRFVIIRSLDAQLLGVQKREIDVPTDLTRTGDIEKLSGDGFTITSTPGFHMCHIGINVRRPILRDVNFRHALFHAYNQKEIIASIHKYTVTPVTSLVPPAQGEWVNPKVPTHPFSPGDKSATTEYPQDHSSCGILRHGGYLYSHAKDNWVTPYDLDGDGTPGTNHPERPPQILDEDEVVPVLRVFTPRYEVTPTVAEHVARWIAELNKMGLTSIQQKPMEVWSYLVKVFDEADFDMYYRGWSLGRFPTHLYDMCHSSQLSYIPLNPGYNAPGIKDPELDTKLETIMYSLNHEEKMEACYEAQRMLYDPETNPLCACTYMQLYSMIFFNAFQPELEGIVDSPGYGSDNDWTFYGIRWQDGVRPSTSENTLVWGLSEEPERLNPCYASSPYAWGILDRVYDGLMNVDPYSHRNISWIATNWELEPFSGAAPNGKEITDGMRITFWLRNDVYWQDGNQFTAWDAKFAWEFLRDNEIPKYMNTLRHTVDVEVVNDYQVVIYSDRTSQYDIYTWAETTAILPPPVWSWLNGKALNTILGFDPSINTTKPAGAGPKFGTPEYPTQLYGTGPFVFDEYNKAEGYVDMYANRDWWLSTDDISSMKNEMFARVGDVNRDGKINIVDLTGIALKFGYTGAPGWVPEDIFGDGVIDILDLATAAYYFGSKKEYGG